MGITFTISVHRPYTVEVCDSASSGADPRPDKYRASIADTDTDLNGFYLYKQLMHFQAGDSNIFVVPLTAAHVMAESCDGTAAAQVTRSSKVCVCVCA